MLTVVMTRVNLADSSITWEMGPKERLWGVVDYDAERPILTVDGTISWAEDSGFYKVETTRWALNPSLCSSFFKRFIDYVYSDCM